MSSQSLVSVIVTTRNEQTVIERLLRSIKNQTYPKIELLVIDNNSDDDTKKISERYTKKIYNYGPERSAQRNYGAQIAKGDYLLFLDADMQLEDKVIEECVDVVTSDKKCGEVTIPEESVAESFWEKVKAFERSFYNIEGDETTDAARFFPKQTFNLVGGYDETITGPEDWDLPENIRKKGYLNLRTKAKIYHYERIKSLSSLMKKKFYYAKKAHRYLTKNKISTFSPKTIYFLRPVFYRQWTRLLLNPFMSLALFVMLTAELLAGGIGFLVGKFDTQ